MFVKAKTFANLNKRIFWRHIQKNTDDIDHWELGYQVLNDRLWMITPSETTRDFLVFFLRLVWVPDQQSLTCNLQQGSEARFL